MNSRIRITILICFTGFKNYKQFVESLFQHYLQNCKYKHLWPIKHLYFALLLHPKTTLLLPTGIFLAFAAEILPSLLPPTVALIGIWCEREIARGAFRTKLCFSVAQDNRVSQ